MNTRQIGFVAAVMFVPGGIALGQSSPPNDDFANRTVLSGSPITFNGTLVGATFESAETDGGVPPGALTTGGSVWWSWTASESTTVTIGIVRDNPSVNSTGTSL